MTSHQAPKSGRVILLVFILLLLALLYGFYLRVGTANSIFSRDFMLFPALDPSIEKQPRLSDAEYCALMPEISEEVAMKVREVLCDATGWDREEIHPKTRIVEFDYY